jgi:CO/xanthine dehydrogenase Mo-binding subunit
MVTATLRDSGSANVHGEVDRRATALDLMITRPGQVKQTVIAAQDDADRVTGALRFAIHRRLAGSTHVCAVRSSVAHGTILEIDASEALTLPGVLAVVTGADAMDLLGERLFHGERRQDQPVIAVDKVRYVGEPVALVIAETRAAAELGAKRVEVDIDELPFVTNQDEAAVPGAPQLHDDWPGNDCGTAQLIHGEDAEEALERAAFVHTATYTSPTANHAALEPHVASAVWLADGTLEVWSGTQAAWQVRRRLAGIFDIPEDHVRVRVDNLGGAFGGKLDLRLEGMVALASKIVGRPVRMELTRDEAFHSSAKHAATVTVSTGCDENGVLVARVIDINYNAGAYAVTTPRAIRTGMIRSAGPYVIPNVLARVRGTYTNTVPTGPFRGAMTGQVCFAGESALDELAAKVGIDGVEIRRRNVMRVGDQYATGEVMQDIKFEEIVEDLARGIDWDAPLEAAPPGVLRGKGLALVIKSTRTPSRSEATATLRADGLVEIANSAAEMGQGAHKSLAQMAAELLNAPAEKIVSVLVDTQHTAYDEPTSSARTTLMSGSAVEDAVGKLQARINGVAAKHWGVDVSALTHRDLSVSCAENGLTLSYADIVSINGKQVITERGLSLSPPGYGELDPETSQGLHTVSWHQGGVAVEVEVDTLTGRVRVVRAHGNSYAGRIIDSMRVRKQLEGGIVFGIGQALMEEMVFDNGELVNANLSDYQIPSILDAPVDITSTAIPADDDHAHPHGLGENAVPPLAPAVANAVYNATGARLRGLPLTAERVLQALSQRAEGAKA